MIRTLALLIATAALTGCARLDGYDRSYSLSYSDGKSTIKAGVTLRGNSGQKAEGGGLPTAIRLPSSAPTPTVITNGRHVQ